MMSMSNKYADISIHTPAKGVTYSLLINGEYTDISIHTPAKGVTLISCNYSLIKKYFNPHSREGSDQRLSLVIFTLDISIHTPAKGVTNSSY